MATKLAFTTLREDQGFPLFWKSHWQRLVNSWKHFKLPGEPDQKSLLVKVCQLLKANPGHILRIDLFDIGEFDFNLRPIHCYEDEPSLKLAIAKQRQIDRHAPSWLKFGDYTERMKIRDEERAQGFDDLLYLDEESFVAESTASNIVWVKDEQLFTPAASRYILHGITINLILNSTKNINQVGQYKLVELQSADAAWLVNAVTGTQRIASIDEHKFSSNLPQLDLDQLYWDLVKADRKYRVEEADHY